MTRLARPALLFTVGCLLLLPACRQEPDGSPPAAGPGRAVPPAALLTTQQAFQDVLARTRPAVVQISAERLVSGGEMERLFENLFGDLFRRPPAGRRVQDLGSGVILDSSGTVVTTARVVAGASGLRVTLGDRRTFPARVVATDAGTGLAALRIVDGEGLPAASLGASEDLKPGQWALALGRKADGRETLSVGVVSTLSPSRPGRSPEAGLIRTDACIDPGTAGGPLFDIYGRVVGISVAAHDSRCGGVAVPAAKIRGLLDRVAGRDSRGAWLGIGIQHLTPELARSLDLERPAGVLVNRVFAGSPAAAAGLRRGDVLLAVDDRPVEGVATLRRLLTELSGGRTVTLEILRDGRRSTLSATPGDPPAGER